MSVRLKPRVTIPRACLRCGVIAMVVCGVAWSRPITCAAQTAVDGESAELKSDAEEFFRNRVTPFIKTFCIDCHSNRRPTEGGVNFNPALKDPGHAAFSQQWKKAVARVTAHDMPPESMEQPTADDRQMFSNWLSKVRFLSKKDPGNQGDLLTTLLSCAGVPLDRPVGIATKQLKEIANDS